jgi:YHS domain-containing protein
MFKYVVAMLCGVSLSGSVYMAGWGPVCQQKAGEVCGDGSCCGSGSAEPMAMAISSGIDMKNTKCIVMGEDVGDSKGTVEYQGKVYHICCSDCVKDFKENPEKWVKALEANPAKFGVAVK